MTTSKFTYEQALKFANKCDACDYVMNILSNYNSWDQLHDNASLRDLCGYAYWFADRLCYVNDEDTGELGGILNSLKCKLSDDIAALAAATWKDCDNARARCKTELARLIDEGPTPESFTLTATGLYLEMDIARNQAQESERVGIRALRVAYIDAFDTLVCDHTT